MNEQAMNNKPKLHGGCTGKGFVKGDERINRSGRPKTFDELRRTADMIANELVPGPDGGMITRGELLLRSWIKSKNPILQRSFIEYWVGKVPDKIEAELQPKTRLTLYYAHEMDAIEADAGRFKKSQGEIMQLPEPRRD